MDPHKDQRLAESLKDHFTLVTARELRFTMGLSHEDVLTIVGMGPSARHITPEDLQDRVAKLPDHVPVTASVRLQAYRPTGVDDPLRQGG